MLVGILSVLKEIKVKKVIIGKQEKENEQYNEFCNIIKERKIAVVMVKKGDIINIEKEVRIKILFPAEELIRENSINNNSIVAKLEYKKFKMLFTGDIEEIAERKLISMYSHNELSADILKTAHHRLKNF